MCPHFFQAHKTPRTRADNKNATTAQDTAQDVLLWLIVRSKNLQNSPHLKHKTRTRTRREGGRERRAPTEEKKTRNMDYIHNMYAITERDPRGRARSEENYQKSPFIFATPRSRSRGTFGPPPCRGRSPATAVAPIYEEWVVIIKLFSLTLCRAVMLK